MFHHALLGLAERPEGVLQRMYAREPKRRAGGQNAAELVGQCRECLIMTDRLPGVPASGMVSPVNENIMLKEGGVAPPMMSTR